MNTLNKKLSIIRVIVTIVFLILTIVGGFFVKKTSLNTRSIVIGIGLDRTDSGILLSAQIVVGGASSTPGSASSYDVLEGEGKTLSEAFDNLSQKTATLPSYAHCNVMFVGKRMLSDGFDEIARLIFGQNILQDNTQIIGVDGKANDAITTSVPILSTPSEYMSREIKLSQEKGGRSVVTLKDFVQRLDNLNGTKYVTFATMVDANPPTGENAKKEKVYLFDLSNTAVYDQENNLKIYGKEITEGVGLIESEGNVITAYDEKGNYVTVQVVKSIKLRYYDKDKLQIDGYYTFYTKIIEQTIAEDKNTLDLSKVTEIIRQTIEDKIENSYALCRKDNVDVYSIRGRMYKRFGIEVDFRDVNWVRHFTVKIS